MKFIFIVSIVFIPLSAFADLNDCNGVWTNKSCSTENKEAVLEAQTADPVKLKEQGQKKSLFHVLNMKNIKASSDYGIKLDLAQAEAACATQSSSIDNCRLQIKELDAVLDTKIKVAAELEIKEKELKLQEEANKIQEQRNKIEQNKPNVVVIQKRKVIIPRDYLKPGKKEEEKGTSIKIESKGNDTKVELEVKTRREETKSRDRAATAR